MNLLHLAGASRNATFFTAHQNKLVAIPPGYCSLIPMVSLISYIHLHICRLCSSFQEPHPQSRFFPNIVMLNMDKVFQLLGHDAAYDEYSRI